ncbi:Hypothetical predicted protein, partial [Marmota monax]
LGAELPEAAAKAAAAASRLGLWPLHSARSAAATAAAQRGLPPNSQLVAPGKRHWAAEDLGMTGRPGGWVRAGKRTAPAACAGTPAYSFGPYSCPGRGLRVAWVLRSATVCSCL